VVACPWKLEQVFGMVVLPWHHHEIAKLGMVKPQWMTQRRRRRMQTNADAWDLDWDLPFDQQTAGFHKSPQVECFPA